MQIDRSVERKLCLASVCVTSHLVRVSNYSHFANGREWLAYEILRYSCTKLICTGNITVKHTKVRCLSFTFYTIEAELTGQHYSRMHTIRLPSIHVLVVTTRCQYSGGGRWLGPQVNKFERVSSDYHQSSVVGEGGDGYQVWCQGKKGGGGRSLVWSAGGDTLPYDLGL